MGIDNVCSLYAVMPGVLDMKNGMERVEETTSVHLERKHVQWQPTVAWRNGVGGKGLSYEPSRIFSWLEIM
jgi:hypothetical protein